MQWVELVAADDDIADDLANKEPTAIEKFMRLLEIRMLQGRTLQDCRQWSMDLGIPEDAFLNMFGVIKRSWKSVPLNFESFCEQRDLARARYLNIYSRASEQNQFVVALKAIDSLVKLDGLEAPTQIQISTGGAPGQGITNSARDQVSQLVEKMKRLAEARMLTSGQADVIEVEAEETLNEDGEIEGRDQIVGPIIPHKKMNGSNGSNGHH